MTELNKVTTQDLFQEQLEYLDELETDISNISCKMEDLQGFCNVLMDALEVTEEYDGMKTVKILRGILSDAEDKLDILARGARIGISRISEKIVDEQIKEQQKTKKKKGD